jgi:hypothetical protein
MAAHLAISSLLEHDGDGVVTYRVEAQSRDFRGAAYVWGNDTDAHELAGLLRAFPQSPTSRVEFVFGTEGTGMASLRFEVAGLRGQCRVWVTISSEYSAGGSDEQESASVCIPFLPAAIDTFCRQLRLFKLRQPNHAELSGNAA